jgi:hypothetical protein
MPRKRPFETYPEEALCTYLSIMSFLSKQIDEAAQDVSVPQWPCMAKTSPA